MDFPTHGVLSATTGILMGDIGAVYEVASYLLGRPAYTHELPLYGDRIKAAILAAHPEVPGDATSENWQKVRYAFVAEHGETFDLDENLRDVLADDRDAISTAIEMMGGRAS